MPLLDGIAAAVLVAQVLVACRTPPLSLCDLRLVVSCV